MLDFCQKSCTTIHNFAWSSYILFKPSWDTFTGKQWFFLQSVLQNSILDSSWSLEYMYISDQSRAYLFFSPLSLSVSSSREHGSSAAHPFHTSEGNRGGWVIRTVLTSNCHPSCGFDTADYAFVIVRMEGIQKTTACCIMTPLPGVFADPGATNCSASSIPPLNTIHSYITHRSVCCVVFSESFVEQECSMRCSVKDLEILFIPCGDQDVWRGERLGWIYTLMTRLHSILKTSKLFRCVTTTQANQSLFTQVTRRPCLQCLQVAIYITARQAGRYF